MEMGRPRTDIDLRVIEEIRRAEPEVDWRRIAGCLYRKTKQTVNFMMIQRRVRQAEGEQELDETNLVG